MSLQPTHTFHLHIHTAHPRVRRAGRCWITGGDVAGCCGVGARRWCGCQGLGGAGAGGAGVRAPTPASTMSSKGKERDPRPYKCPVPAASGLFPAQIVRYGVLPMFIERRSCLTICLFLILDMTFASSQWRKAVCVPISQVPLQFARNDKLKQHTSWRCLRRRCLH